jgi:hypothetical protein
MQEALKEALSEPEDACYAGMLSTGFIHLISLPWTKSQSQFHQLYGAFF